MTAPAKRRTIIKLTMRQLLKKLGLKPKDVLRIWYSGDDYQHGVSFGRDSQVYLEITVEK